MKKFQVKLAFMVILILIENKNAKAFQFSEQIPSLTQAIKSNFDLYGQIAENQKNGASYEYFAKLLPAPRYVNADFRYYPIVLSAPESKIKARLISNGQGVNIKSGSRSWKDIGQPATFRVGPDEFLFGGLQNRVSLPTLLEGWLPIITIDYIHPSPFQSEGAVPIDQKPINQEKEVYRLEAFVSTEKHITENAVVFVQFSIVSGKEGKISVQNESPDKVQIQNSKKNLPSDEIHIYADSNWTFSRGMIHAILKPGLKATIAIPTKTISENSFKFNDQSFQVHKEETIKVWKSIISKATQVEVSEVRINNAWKNLIVQNFMLINNDKIFYSSGNQYEQLYSAEGSEAVLSLLNWNYEEKAKALIVPILDFSRKGLEYHQAGIKLLDVIKIWQQTKDIVFIKEMRPRWEKELFKILNNRGDENGLLPKEKYCGDISTPVHSLAVDAKAWRSLKDIQPLLKELKAVELLNLVEKEEKRYKENIIKALEVSILKGTNPPFIPIALFGKEETHSPIPSTRIGSYWNLIIGFVIASKIFPLGSIEESFIPDYQEKNGGIFMGMIRSGGTSHAFWTGSERINPLYGSRYSYDLLRRDLPEKYLVGFYGMLSQGFTRNTFIGGEGSTLEQVDDGGRFFYCPPNSASNAHFLSMLKNMMVHEIDEDDDGEPETLRLGFATSKRWLENDATILVKNAPSSFGLVSFRIQSIISKGIIKAQVEIPSRNRIKKIMFRVRVPDGNQIKTVKIDGKDLFFDQEGTINLSQYSGIVEIEYAVQKN